MTWKQIQLAKEHLLSNGLSYDTVLNMSVDDIMKRYAQMQEKVKPTQLDQFMNWLEQDEHCTKECFELVRLYNEWKKVK